MTSDIGSCTSLNDRIVHEPIDHELDKSKPESQEFRVTENYVPATPDAMTKTAIPLPDAKKKTTHVIPALVQAPETSAGNTQAKANMNNEKR